MLRYFFLSFMLFMVLSCQQQPAEQEPVHAAFLKAEATWADSIVLSMTIDEKIGQLLIFQPELNDSLQIDSLIRLAANNKLGGIILEDLPIRDYMTLLDEINSVSKIPVFNASAEQVSFHNRFSDLTDLPTAASICAVEDDSLQEQIRNFYLDQMSNLGINLSFTPTFQENADLEAEYNYDLFTSESERNENRSLGLIRDIQKQNILSVAGTFKDYYQIENDTTGILDSILFEYKELVQLGLSGMVIDSSILQIDTILKLPPYFIKRYLKNNLEFDGLLIADWNNTSFRDMTYAGVELFVVRDNYENRFNSIKGLVEDGTFTQEALNERVIKILQAKSWIGIDSIRPQLDRQMAGLIMENGFDDFEIRRLYEAGMTLVQNPDDLLPFKKTYKKHFSIVQVGEEDLWEFQKYFSKYAGYSLSNVKKDTAGSWKPLSFNRYKRSKVILTLDQTKLHAHRDSNFLNSVNLLGESADVVIVNFGAPSNLIHFDSTIALVQLFERTPLTESFAAQLLFGALQAKGKLPLTLNERLVYGTGIDDTPVIRLKYTVPEEVGIAAYRLVGIDAIARSAIQDRATPGCQVLVAKDGKVIYSKSFGKHDFRKGKLVQKSDLYDLASITKVASTTLGMMELYDQGKLKLNQKLKDLIELDKKSPIKNITVKQLLTHQSGLQPNMPIASYIMYKDTTGTGCSGPFCKEKKLSYVTEVADSFYLDFKYQDSIWQEVYNLKPGKRKRYRYSDVNFNLLMKVIESKEKQTLDEFINQNFYLPLSLDRLTYNPLTRFKKQDVVPTTNEKRFRNQLIHGHVHDESAALLGGVAGNAGLFGNAESLATVFQMLLNGGDYGGKEYVKEETVNLFTKQQYGTKRGLGFDVNSRSASRSCSPQASDATYGHTGFTGTCVWVDPETDLIFILLTNRIHPDVNNKVLFRKNTRTRMHNLVYESLNTYPEDKKQEEEPKIVHAEVSQGD